MRKRQPLPQCELPRPDRMTSIPMLPGKRVAKFLEWRTSRDRLRDRLVTGRPVGLAGTRVSPGARSVPNAGRYVGILDRAEAAWVRNRTDFIGRTARYKPDGVYYQPVRPMGFSVGLPSAWRSRAGPRRRLRARPNLHVRATTAAIVMRPSTPNPEISAA